MRSKDDNALIHEANFKDWMRRLRKADNEPYTTRTVDRYARALRQLISEPVFDEIDISNIFEISTTSIMTDLDEKIRNTNGFKEFDQSHGHGDLSAALALYRQFIKANDNDNREYSKAMNTDTVKRFVNNFKMEFPDFITFAESGASFLKNEDTYKRAAVQKMSDIFREWTEKTPESINDTEFTNGIRKIFSATNLVDFRTNLFIKDNFLQPDNIGEFKSLALSLVGQAFKGNVEASTFDQFAAFLEKHGARVSHSKLIPSYLLMLANPSKYIFIKPILFKRFSADLGVPMLKKGERLKFENYESVLAFFNSLGALIADLRPRDMLDLQSFYYVVMSYKSSTDEKLKGGGENNNIPRFDCDAFADKAKTAGIVLSGEDSCAMVSCLQTKRFLILTGLSGSGKTQLAMAFAKWVSASKDQYALIAVGADWTSNENLLGYSDALSRGQYRKPDNGAMDLILRARKDHDHPYFLILDEMNLSHVERYFADFLSAMESGEAISLHDGGENDLWDDVPGKLKIPDNVFVIGTVNVDETTYMFSPKVLDRANVIEFRVSEDEMQGFLENPVKPDLEVLAGKGKEYAEAFLNAAQSKDVKLDDVTRKMVSAELMRFFPVLQEAGAEFGYRTAHEICRFMYFYGQLVDGEDDASVGDASSPAEAQADMGVVRTGMDAAIMQKLLPKLHGSKKKLGPVLEKLAELCPAEQYPTSAAKIARMQQRLADHGFTSFAEA